MDRITSQDTGLSFEWNIRNSFFCLIFLKKFHKMLQADPVGENLKNVTLLLFYKLQHQSVLWSPHKNKYASNRWMTRWSMAEYSLGIYDIEKLQRNPYLSLLLPNHKRTRLDSELSCILISYSPVPRGRILFRSLSKWKEAHFTN